MKLLSKIISAFFILIVLSKAVSAQFTLPRYTYFPTLRPAGIEWKQIKTEHFRIIFPDGEDSLAIRSAEILEFQFPSAQKLTGGSLKNFPVILKNYNDLSNGSVHSYNFRSEVDLSPIKGKELDPATGGWLESVLPHELVHAAHFNVQQNKGEQKFSIPTVISYFSPDLARSIHGFAPYGFHEGLAVYYESNFIHPGSGRGNFNYFTNLLNANFSGPGRWNIGQSLIIPEYNYPFSRHYLAGSSFISWLQEQYGESFARNAIRFHYHHFMFGFGYTLKQKTGKWPNQLFKLYVEYLTEKEQQRLESVSVNTNENSRIVTLPFKGNQLRAPKWLSENELLFYGSFYNASPGFYHFDLKTNTYELVKDAFAVGDQNFSIDKSKNLIYSSYNGHSIYPGIYQADVQKLDLKTGKQIAVTKGKRIYSPTVSGNRIFAIQSDGTTANIVEIVDGRVQIVKDLAEANPVHLKVNPANENQIAVVMNKRGTQALWICNVDRLDEELDRLPDLAFKNASVFDPEWHPDGEKLLFSLDLHPAMNIYEFDLESGRILQLTSSLYNAFEASYSPKADAIAYIIQAADERKVAILQSANFVNHPIADSLIFTEDELKNELSRPLVGEGISESYEWKIEDYNTDWSWLKPRIIMPVIYDKAGSPQWGVGLSSIDVLQSQSYYLEFTGIQNRLWYDFTYSNRSFFPGFDIDVYNDPQFFAVRLGEEEALRSVMRQDRGFSLSVPLEYAFRNNTRYSSIYFSPEISAEQFKYYNLAPDPISDFATRYKAGAFSQLSLNVRSLPRDVQPSSGLILFGLLERSLNESTINLNFGDAQASQTFSNQWAAYYGTFFYLAPLQRWNQSLRVDFRLLQQSTSPIYSNSTIIPMGFSDTIFADRLNLGRLSTRYTIPLLYPDSGWLTLPLYLSSVYITLFSHTVTDLEAGDLLDSSRSIFGSGLHFQWKLSNVAFDFGIGLAFEPTRGNTQFIYGEF